MSVRVALCMLVLAVAAVPAAMAQGVEIDLTHQAVTVDPAGQGVTLVAPLPIDTRQDGLTLRSDADAAPTRDAQPDHEASPIPFFPAELAAAPAVSLSAPPPVALPLGSLTEPALRVVALDLPLDLVAPASSQDPVAPPQAIETASAAPPAPAPPAAMGAASAGVGIVAVAAASALAPVAPFGWDRLRRALLGAALYTRIAKERLLDHGSREKLLLTIRDRPGLPVTDLAGLAGVPRNTATYHLRRLEREGLVVSQRDGRVRLWFSPGGDARREEAPAFAALRHDTTRAIALEVAAKPGMDQQALCARFGLAPSLAHWHADRLVMSGLVRKERDGRRVRYYPTEGLPRMAGFSG